MMDVCTEKPQTELTYRQREIYDFISHSIREEGAPPTIHEIANHFQLKSTYGIRQHLKLMEKKGCISRIPGKARGIQLTPKIGFKKENELWSIPMLGRIAAGQPLLAFEEAEQHIKIEAGVFRGCKLFALRVQGDSMIHAGIHDGDIAIIDQQTRVSNGEIAAVLLDDEATLKRVRIRKNCMVLQAENEKYSDITLRSNTKQHVRIIGRYVGLIRPT